MDAQAPNVKTQATPAEASKLTQLREPSKRTRPPTRVPAIVVGVVIAVIAGMAIWYMVRPLPLLVQGEVTRRNSTSLRASTAASRRSLCARGENVGAGAVLVRIDNPETLAKHQQALAAKVVAEAQLANIKVGTRPEVIAARKAAFERAQASVVLAQKTFERVARARRTQQRLAGAPRSGDRRSPEKASARSISLDRPMSRRSTATPREERQIAVANVQKAGADIAAVQSIIDQMVVYAPIPSQIYQRNVEPGEYVSPGVPLVTLIDLADLWVHFDLRERPDQVTEGR